MLGNTKILKEDETSGKVFFTNKKQKSFSLSFSKPRVIKGLNDSKKVNTMSFFK